MVQRVDPRAVLAAATGMLIGFVLCGAVLWVVAASEPNDPHPTLKEFEQMSTPPPPR